MVNLHPLISWGLPDRSSYRYNADELHVIAQRIETSSDSKVQKAAQHIRRAADLLYEAAKENERA